MAAPPPTARTATRPTAAGRSGHPSGDERFALIDTALKKARYAPDHLIEILHVAQGVFGHLSEDVLRYVGAALRLPASRVQGVATFYHLFNFDPPGDHTCTVCTGTACFVQGADAIVAAVQARYGVAAGQTTDDGRLTLSTARCLGSCGLAPVVVLDGQVSGHLDVEAALAQLAANLATDTDADTGTGTGIADTGDAAPAGDTDVGADAGEVR